MFLPRQDRLCQAVGGTGAALQGALHQWGPYSTVGPGQEPDFGLPQACVSNHHQHMAVHLGSDLDISAAASPTAFPASTFRVPKTKTLGFHGCLSPSHTPHASSINTSARGSSFGIDPESANLHCLPGCSSSPRIIFSCLGHCHGLLTGLPAPASAPSTTRSLYSCRTVILKHNSDVVTLLECSRVQRTLPGTQSKIQSPFCGLNNLLPAPPQPKHSYLEPHLLWLPLTPSSQAHGALSFP